MARHVYLDREFYPPQPLVEPLDQFENDRIPTQDLV